MAKVSTLASYFYNHHVVRYLFVGGTTFIIDLGLLLILNKKVGLAVWAATAIAYITAFVYNFTLNRWWTFSAADTNTLKKHIAPYTVLFLFNLIFTTVFVSAMSKPLHSVAIAKTLAVIIQTTWNFIVYKYVIFVKPRPAQDSAETRS